MAQAAVGLRDVREAQGRGDALLAYDLAMRALEQGDPDQQALRYQALLALLNSGATDAAEELYRTWRLDDVADEDLASLPGRFAKLRFNEASGDERARHAQRSAGAYARVYKRTLGYYPGINAATMSLFAGNAEAAVELARKLLTELPPPEEGYYSAATRAEALLLVNDLPAASAAIATAAEQAGGNLMGLASTRRQLIEICRVKGIDPSLLEPLAPPCVIHYCGPMSASGEARGRLPAGSEERVRAAVARELARLRVGIAFGALAAGADLLVAEELLNRGGELFAVLPLSEAEFARVSVAPAGARWVERYRACLARARAVTCVSEGAHEGDELMFSFGSRVAMGLAALRSRSLSAPLTQLAVENEAEPGSHTQDSVDHWQSLGLPQVRVPFEPSAGSLLRPDPARDEAAGRRRLVAVLFSDLTGFSKLTESQVRAYWSSFMPNIARVLDSAGSRILAKNTWGDALYVVLADAESAAECAMQLQEYLRRADLASLGLPADLAMRLAVHYGPVFDGWDPVAETATYYGTTVSRTARIEPITPPGQVYVTESFAAVLALEAPDRFACDYVGQMPAAKGYGTLRMYRLRAHSSR